MYRLKMIRYNPHIKRLLDVTISIFAITLLLPFLIVISILICVDSKGPPFFIHERIGKGMRPFRLVKFRSMTYMKNSSECQFEPGENCRVTKVGRVLRKTKIDELPELINIFKGDMSITGPRPEVSQYVQRYPEEFKAILQIRPGLSDYASVRYRDEEEILAMQADPDNYYLRVILPDKLFLARQYTENISFGTDWHIILETLRSILL
ncbi:MAG: sugar transferase [Desulfobacterales bacterium]|nr:sugar transferase [Desulfobacterales bacterium]